MTGNDEADWDQWPVHEYLAENYRRLHPGDAAVIRHHARWYRQMEPGSIARSVEFGAGPNLYPLMLAAAVSRCVDAVDIGAGNIAYLRRQLAPDSAPDASWQPFYTLCRRYEPRLPATLAEALTRVRVVHRDVREIPPSRYGLASMHFVAESVTEDFAEFTALCRTYVRTVRPGGRLIAAFMENMPSYRVGRGLRWPACPVDSAGLRTVFGPLTEELRLSRIASDPTLPDYGDTGMVLLTALRRRPAAG